MRSRFGSSLFLALMACGPSLDSPKNTKFDWSMIEHHPLKDDFENCLMVDGEAFRALHVSLSGAEPSISLFPGLMGAAPTNEFERARQEKGLKDAVSDLAKQHLEGSSCVEQRISVSQYDFDSNHFSLGSPQETVKVDVPLGIVLYSERLVRAKIRFTNVEDEAFFPSKAKIKAEPAEAEAWLDQLGPGRSLNALILLKPEKGGHEEYHNEYWELLGHNRGVLVTTPLGKVVAVFSGEVPTEPGKASIAKADDDVDESMPTEPGKGASRGLAPEQGSASSTSDVQGVPKVAKLGLGTNSSSLGNSHEGANPPSRARINTGTANAVPDVTSSTQRSDGMETSMDIGSQGLGSQGDVSMREKVLKDPQAIKQMISSVVRDETPMLGSCYDSRLRRRPKLEGEWELSFTIQTSGEVANAAAKGREMRDSILEDCLVNLLNRWRFSPISTAQPVKKTVPFQTR